MAGGPDPPKASGRPIQQGSVVTQQGLEAPSENLEAFQCRQASSRAGWRAPTKTGSTYSTTVKHVNCWDLRNHQPGTLIYVHREITQLEVTANAINRKFGQPRVFETWTVTV